MEKIMSHKFDAVLNLEAYEFKQTTQAFTPHFHDYYVVGYVESGHRTLYYNNKLYEINSGNFFLANPYDTHSCNFRKKNPMNYFSLVLPQALIKIESNSPFLNSQPPRFSSPIISDKNLLKIFFDVYESFFYSNHDDTVKTARFSLLNDYLHEHYLTNFSQKTADNYNLNYKISLIIDYFRKNLTQDISLKDICNQFQIKPTSFFVHFEKKIGISPRRYLIVERINEAKRLLKKGTLVSHVALLAGFCDHSHFTHTFRSIEGITPNQYRKSFFK